MEGWICGLIFVSSHLVTESFAYRVSSTPSSWMESSNVCTLASPLWNASKTGFVINSASIPTNISYPVWVGHYRYHAVFDYVGCIQLDNKHKPKTGAGSPAYCFPACKNSTVVGMNSQWCYCLDDKDLKKAMASFNNECDIQCTRVNVACGGKDHMSVYRVTDSVPEGTDSCLSRTGDMTDSWKNCSTSLTVVACEFDSSDVTIIDEGESWKWLEAANECFDQQRQPVSYKLRKQSPGAGQFWTGVFRTLVFHTRIYESFLPGNNWTNVQFGYINQSNGVNYLQFSDPGSSTLRQLLCEDGGTPETKRTTTASSLKPESTTAQDSDDLTTTGIAVGVSVTVVMVTAVIVLVVCFTRRGSWRCFGGKDKQTDLSVSVSEGNFNYATIPSASDDVTIAKEGHASGYEYTYGRLQDRQKKTEEAGKTETAGNSNKLTFDTKTASVNIQFQNAVEDTVYNRTNGKETNLASKAARENKNRKLETISDDSMYQVTEHNNAKQTVNAIDTGVYHTVQTTDENAYDQTENIKSKNKGSSLKTSGNIYGSNATENVYDVSAKGRYAKNDKEIIDNTYGHLKH